MVVRYIQARITLDSCILDISDGSEADTLSLYLPFCCIKLGIGSITRDRCSIAVGVRLPTTQLGAHLQSLMLVNGSRINSLKARFQERGKTGLAFTLHCPHRIAG